MTSPLPMQGVIAIHGGAGAMAHHGTDPEQASIYHDALGDIVRAAQGLLLQGRSALDAVTLAVEMLEDCPLFNAGHGAVFTRDETHELDAAIMDGANLRAGAVACVGRIRRPIRAARAVMEQGEHVLLVAQGAERFAQSRGLEMVAQDYFSTELRRAQLHQAIALQTTLLDHDAEVDAVSVPLAPARPLDEGRKFGTVGAVALDVHGNLAAATSTGGMTYKRAGRVGDAPLIGAGTYADNRSAAVSCTGSGEMFIRAAAAHDVCARMAYGGASLAAAVHSVVMDELPRIGGRGGLIAIDAAGNLSLVCNTDGMYRGFARGAQAPQTAILR